MSRKISLLFLATTTMVATQLSAIPSIIKMLEDPAIIATFPEGRNIEEMKNFYSFIVETPYNECNKRFGDTKTEQLSEQMIDPMTQYFLSFRGKEIDTKSVDIICDICTEFITHLKNKSEITNQEAMVFFGHTVNMCLTIAELKLTKIHEFLENLTEQERIDFALKIQNGTLAQRLTEIQKEHFSEFFEVEFVNEPCPDCAACCAECCE